MPKERGEGDRKKKTERRRRTADEKNYVERTIENEMMPKMNHTYEQHEQMRDRERENPVQQSIQRLDDIYLLGCTCTCFPCTQSDGTGREREMIIVVY